MLSHTEVVVYFKLYNRVKGCCYCATLYIISVIASTIRVRRWHAQDVLNQIITALRAFSLLYPYFLELNLLISLFCIIYNVLGLLSLWWWYELPVKHVWCKVFIYMQIYYCTKMLIPWVLFGFIFYRPTTSGPREKHETRDGLLHSNLIGSTSKLKATLDCTCLFQRRHT